MGKEKRYRNFSVFVRGSAVTIGVYLVIVAVAALLVVKGIVPEKTKEGMIAGAGFVAALAGGRTVVGQGGLGTLLPAVLNAAIFVGVLIAVKLIGGTPGGWGDCGWLLLICILAGGTVSGLWRGEKKRRRRSVGVRMCSKGRG
jgi:hypothetical protein